MKDIISERFSNGSLELSQYEPSSDVRQLGDPLYFYSLDWSINNISGSESFKSFSKAAGAYNNIKKLFQENK